MKIFYAYYLKTAFSKNIAFSARIQSLLQWFGIAIHNPWRDECCCDFECCAPKKQDFRNRCWLHISAKSIPIRQIVRYEETAPIGTHGRIFVKKTKWKFGKDKKQKEMCANYTYWCDRIAKNCKICKDYRTRNDFGEDE